MSDCKGSQRFSVPEFYAFVPEIYAFVPEIYITPKKDSSCKALQRFMWFPTGNLRFYDASQKSFSASYFNFFLPYSDEEAVLPELV